MQDYFHSLFYFYAATFCLTEAIKNSSEVVHSYFFAAQRLVRLLQADKEKLQRLLSEKY
jgi:hypothetical protein